MKIKANILEEIRTNEDIIRELSRSLNITCEQMKDILIEDALASLYAGDDDYEMRKYLKDKYLE